MKSASLTEIKKEINLLSPLALADLLLTISKYKRENKDLLSYLLFYSHNQEQYIEIVKQQIDLQFDDIAAQNSFQFKKPIRKILKYTQKHIKFSASKKVEVELLMHFCYQFKKSEQWIFSSTYLMNLYQMQIKKIHKALDALHEDYKFDYQNELQKLIL
jgi:hypothetical protein